MGKGYHRTPHSCLCLIRCICDETGECLIIQFGVVRQIPGSLVSLKVPRQSPIILRGINAAESDWNDTALRGHILRGLNEQLRDKRAAGNTSPGRASLISVSSRLNNCLRERWRERATPQPYQVISEVPLVEH